MAGRIYETTIRLSAQLASTFKSVTGGAAGALERLGKEAAKLKSVDRSTEVFARLQNEVAAAEREAHTAATALVNLATAAKATTKPTKELGQWLDYGTKAAKRASERLDKAREAAAKAGLALQIAGVDTSKLTAEQVRLALQLEKTERRMKAIGAAQAANKRIFGDKGISERIFGDPKEARIDKFSRQARGLAGTALGLGAAGAAASAGLFALLKRAADTGDAIDDAAGRLNIGGAALQAFHAQAKIAGGSAEDADTAIGKLGINIGKLLAAKKKGGGGAAFGDIEGLTVFGKDGAKGASGAGSDPFKRLGLNVKQLAQLKPEQQVEAIADKVAGLKTQSEQAAATVAVFGKGGLKMLPLLRDGAAGIRRFREEGVRTGRFMSDEATKSASDFNDALEELQSRGVNSVVNALAGTLLPVGTKTFKDLTKWVGENQGKIRTWAETAKQWIEGKAIPALKSAATWFLETGAKVMGVVTRVADLVGGFGNLAIAIGLLKAAPLIATSGQIVLAVGKMAAAVVSYALALDGAAASQKALGASSGLGVPLGAAGGAVAAGATITAAGLAAVAVHDRLLDVNLMDGFKRQQAEKAARGEVRSTTGFKGWYNRYLGGNLTDSGPTTGPRTNTGGSSTLTVKLEHAAAAGTDPATIAAGIDAASPALLARVKAMLDAERAERARLAF